MVEGLAVEQAAIFIVIPLADYITRLSVTTVLALSLFCLCVVGTKTAARLEYSAVSVTGKVRRMLLVRYGHVKVLHDYDMGKPIWFSFTRLCCWAADSTDISMLHLVSLCLRSKWSWYHYSSQCGCRL